MNLVEISSGYSNLLINFELTDDFTKQEAEIVIDQIRREFGGSEIERFQRPFGAETWQTGLRFAEITLSSSKMAQEARKRLRRLSRAGRGGFKFEAWIEGID